MLLKCVRRSTHHTHTEGERERECAVFMDTAGQLGAKWEAHLNRIKKELRPRLKEEAMFYSLALPSNVARGGSSFSVRALHTMFMCEHKKNVQDTDTQTHKKI